MTVWDGILLFLLWCDYRWSFAGLDALVLLGKVMDPDPFGPCIDPLSGYWSQYVP